MSENINVVMLSGNLTRDPELTTSQGGTQILRFGLAVNERRKSPQSGEWEDVPNFFDCTMFGNRAAALAQYLRKGTKVAAKGRLHWHSWEAQDGTKRSKVDVIVDQIEFMSRSQQGQQQPQQAYQPAQQQYAQPAYRAPAQQPAQPRQQTIDDVYDEDIPF